MPPPQLRPGWWQAADGQWYPPERHPNYIAPSQHVSVRTPVRENDSRAAAAVQRSAPRTPLLEPRTPLWRRWWFLLVAAVVAVAVVVNLASSNEEEAAPAGPGEDAGSVQPTTATDNPSVAAADQAAASAALLVLADFPVGWSEVPSEDDSEGGGSEINECLGLPGDFMDLSGPTAETGDFTDPDGDVTVSQSVGIATTVDEAVAATSVLARPDLPACLQSTFRESFDEMVTNPPTPADSLPPGASIGEVTVARLNVRAAGEQIDAFRLTTPITVDGSTLSFYSDVVYVRSGRAVTAIQFASSFTPWATEDIDIWVELAASRLSPASSPPPDEMATTTQASTEVDGFQATCAYSGTDPDFGDMQVDLTFTNPLGDVNELEVTYALLDGEGGMRFFTGSTFIYEQIMFPVTNEQFRLAVDTGEDVPPNIEATTIDCTVLAIEESTDIGGFARATAADTCTVLGVDSSGRAQVELAVTSPYAQTTTVQTWWALYGPGPMRFETETEVVDLVGAGESFRIIPAYGTEKPGWIGDGEVTCAVVGFWDQGR